MTRQKFPQGVGLGLFPQQDENMLFLCQPAGDFVDEQIHLPLEAGYIGRGKADGLGGFGPVNLLQQHGRVNHPIFPGRFLNIFPAKHLVLDVGIFPHHGTHLFPQAHGFIEEHGTLPFQIGQEHFCLTGAVRLRQRHDGRAADVFQGALSAGNPLHRQRIQCAQDFPH